MPRSRWARIGDLVAVAAGGCAAGDVPSVVGATDAQADAVLEAFAAFRAEVVDDLEPEVGRVVFRSFRDEDVAGEAGHGTVLVLETATPEEVGPIVRHELCHHVDLRAGLSAAHAGDWPAIPAIPSSDGTPESLRLELFAYVCMMGPEGVGLLRDLGGSCVPEGMDDVAAVLVDEVFEPGLVEPVVTFPATTRVARWTHWDAAPQVDAVFHVKGLTRAWATDDRPFFRAPAIPDLSADPSDRTVALLDLDEGDWVPVGRPRGWAATNEVVAAPPQVEFPGWVDEVDELPTRVRVRLRKTWLPTGAMVSVVAADTDPRVYADACLPGRPELSARTRAIATHVNSDATPTTDDVSWIELTALLDAQYGTGWHAPPGTGTFGPP